MFSRLNDKYHIDVESSIDNTMDAMVGEAVGTAVGEAVDGLWVGAAVVGQSMCSVVFREHE